MPISYNTLTSGSGAAGEDFTINIGSSGFTKTDLGRSFGAGNYICTSSLSDSTLDIYFLNEDGTVAGFVNAAAATSTISASKTFRYIVIYGGSNNDTLTFQYKTVAAPTSNSTSDVSVGPRIISISTSSLPNINDTTVITGQNFASNVQVAFTGTGYSSTAAKSVVRNSSTSLTVTRPDNFPPSGSPYTITVTNPGTPSPTSTNSHILASSVTSGSAPVWVTSATLPQYNTTNSYSTTIQATDSDGGSSVSYSVVSGSLPTGITFNTSTATFSGTTSSTGNFTYTIRATDSGGNFVDRAFTIPQQTLPNTPTSLVTSWGTTAATAGQLTLSWTAPTYVGTSSLTGYTVYRNGVLQGTTASTSYTQTVLANGSYSYTVTANNSSGSSVASSASATRNVITRSSSGSVSVPSGTLYYALAIGGGGGGGGGGGATGNPSSGGGGGGAGSGFINFGSATSNGSVSVTVGGAGSGGSYGPAQASQEAGTPGQTGSAGGTTTVGSITASGGSAGGAGLNSAGAGAGGSGASGGGGGGGGGYFRGTAGVGGNGGSYGASGTSGGTTTNGAAPGSGGSGGGTNAAAPGGGAGGGGGYAGDFGGSQGPGSNGASPYGGFGQGGQGGQGSSMSQANCCGSAQGSAGSGGGSGYGIIFY